MDLRDKLKHYLTISNFIESENTYTDDAILQDAIDSQLKSLKLYGKSALLPKDYLSSVTAYGKIEQRNIPKDYIELEYIESTGTQRINANINGNATIKITAQANIIKGSSQALLSSTSGAMGGTWFGEFTTNQKWGIGTDVGLTTIAPTTKITAEITFDAAGCRGTINNQTVTREAAVTQGGWWIMSDASNTYPFNGKVWKCQIIKNNVVVRNFIPARRKSDNVVGMYDIVSGTFFTNAGTGDFVAGPVISVPDEYTRLEYLQGDGTAYIDLGISLTQDDEFELDFKMPSSSVSMQNIFGYRNSASSNAITAMIASSSNAFVTDFNNSDYSPYRLLTNISASTEYKVITSKNSRVLYQGDTVVDSNTTACGDTITTGNVLLFNIGGSPAYTNKFTGSISKAIIKNRINLIPVKRNLDGVLGMYDVLNNTFLTNANTSGAFTAGPEVITIPTPDNPINLCCNNGVIYPELLNGYRILDYLQGDGSSYILTNLRISNTDVIETEFQNNSASAVGAIYGEYVKNNASALYSNGTYYGYDSALNKVDTGVSIDTEWHNSVHDFTNGTITIDNTTVTFTPYTFTNDIDNALFARYYNSNYGYCYNGKIKKFKVIRNGTVISNLIPVMRASDSVLGMYDTITGDFWTGTGTFTYGSIADTNIKVSGIKEKVTDGLAQINQFNKNHYTEITAYVNANTGVITVGTTQKCAVIPCKPNTTYKITGRTSSAWGSFTSYAIGSTATTYVRTDNVLTTGPNDIYLAGLVRTTDDTYNYLDTLTIVDLSSGTATCEMLCGMGDYKDSQEVLSGNITRNIGVIVLDGTETGWTKLSGVNYVSLPKTAISNMASGTDATCLSNSFAQVAHSSISLSEECFSVGVSYVNFKKAGDPTTAQFKQWLANQYAAGTPVMVIYPLATPTTESVTPQTNLKLAPVSVLEASIDNLELSYTTSAVSTPTPEKPLDIGCNNGIIDDKYEQLEYLESAGTQYIDTGIVPTNTFGFEVDIAPKNVTTDSAKIGVRDNSSTASRCWWGASAGAAYLGWNNIISQNQSTPVAIGTFYNIKVNYLNDRNYMFNGEQINTTPLETLNTFSDTSTFILFGTSVAGTVKTNNSKDSKISRATFTNNDEIIMDLIPARRKSDNVLGMLDLVSGNFLTNSGTGTFTAGNVAGTIANGNREVIKVGSKNLLNDTPYKIGYYIDANGNEIEATQYQEEYLIRQARVQPLTRYTISLKGVVSGYTQRIHAYDAAGNWLSQIAIISAITPGAVTSTSIATPANCIYIRQGGRSQTEYQLEKSERPTEYHNYITTSYKNPVSLLGVGDYKDSYDMINGGIIRNVGIKILDGTENIGKSGVYRGSFFVRNVVTDWGTSNNANVYCSHYDCVTSDNDYAQNKCMILNNAFNMWWAPDNTPTVEQFSQWLATQYAIGTPVIVIYPLATPTTSTTSNENIDVTCGSPSISRESDYINNLTMGINYLKLK